MTGQAVETVPLQWGLFMPGADGPYATFDSKADALSSLAAGPGAAFVAPLDLLSAMRQAWFEGASEGLRTPPHLGYMLSNPYVSATSVGGESA